MTAIYDTDDNGDITVCGGTEMVVIEGQSDREAPYGKHRCPYCEREIGTVLYTEWGQKVWNGKEWEDDRAYGSAEFRCSECNGSLDYEELVAMGVV